MRDFLTAIIILAGLFWRYWTKTTLGAIALMAGILLVINLPVNICFYHIARNEFGMIMAMETVCFVGAVVFWSMSYAGYGILVTLAIASMWFGLNLTGAMQQSSWLGYIAVAASLGLVGMLFALQAIEVGLFFALVDAKLVRKKELIDKWSDPEFSNSDVLILTASAGSGHIVAARNIALALEAQSKISVSCMNIFDFLSPRQRRFQESVWEYLATYTPKIYRPIHRFILWDVKLLVKKEAERVANTLAQLAQKSPSVVVATHPMAVAIGSELKKRWGSRLVVIPTDYYLHPHYTSPNVDLYCLPSRECLFVGVDKEKLSGKSLVTGIPIAEPMLLTRSVARKKLGIPENRVVVFVNFGGTAILRTKIFIELLSLVLYCEKPVHFLLPKVLYAKLPPPSKKWPSPPRSKSSWSEVSNIWLALEACDVMIGKVGGLSISEALSLDIPVGIWHHGGPEDFNAKFLLQTKRGIRIGGIRELLLDFPRTKEWINRCAKVTHTPHDRLGRASLIAREIVALMKGGST